MTSAAWRSDVPRPGDGPGDLRPHPLANPLVVRCAAISISKSPLPSSKPRSRSFAPSPPAGDAVAIAEEIAKLEAKANQALKDLYASLTPWQKTQVARHPQRPHFIDYVQGLITDFTPLAGDRKFGEDEAIVGGFGRFRGEPVVRDRPGEGLRPPRRASSTISAWRGPRATARRCG